MKKNLFIYAALCALVATGCSEQDEAETLQPGQGEALNVTISATRHEAPSTRTEYEEAADRLIVKWSSDKSDKLGVFTTVGNDNLTKNAPFAVDGALSTDGKTAHFKGSLNVSYDGQEASIYGYYPYNSAAGDTPEAIPIDLSGQQQDGISGEGSLAHLAAKDYMAATVTKNLNAGDQNLSLEFNPLLTIMSFKITKAMNVQSIKLEAAGTTNPKPFYTRRAVNITSSTPYFIPGGTKQSSVELDVTNGTISTTGMFNMMIFPIAKEAMPAEFKATVTTTDGKTYVQTKSAPATGFERGKRYIMELDALTEDDTVWGGISPAANDAYEYSGGADTPESPYQIAKAKDLAQLAANVNAKFDASNNFILMKDINLKEHEWTPIGQSGATFKGTFDGGGKVITGMKITELMSYAGLFGWVETGTIKNINVAGEINISKKTASAIYAGGILGLCDNATLSGNLTNHVNITIVTTPYNSNSDLLYIGGVAGRITNKAVADVTLVNAGILKISGSAAVRVGGVIGEVNVDIQQGTTLINSGAVSGTSSGEVCRVGGLIGYSTNTVAGEGTNTGNVMGKSGHNSVYSGGFIGYTTNAVTIESILNTGTVTAESVATVAEVPSYAGIRVGGAENSINLVEANNNADGTPGSTAGITATAINGNKSYVNGVETTSTPQSFSPPVPADL